MRFLLFLLCFPPGAFAQLKRADIQKLDAEVQVTFDQFNVSLGMQPYSRMTTLDKAAQLHAVYLAGTTDLSENQKKGKNKTVLNQIKSAKAECDEAAQLMFEFTDVEKASQLRDRINMEVYTSLEANESVFFRSYNCIGYAWSYRAKTKSYILSVVLGHEKEIIPGQLSKNGFGLQRAPNDCSGFLNYHELTILMNCIFIEDNKVILRYHNKKRFLKLFPNATDGLVIDLLRDDQFPCDGPNILDGSAIYDGILLKPLYRDDFLKGNLSTGDYRLEVVLGIVPEELHDIHVMPNVLYIKNGQVCRYNVIHYIDGEDYGLAPIDPIFQSPAALLNSIGSVRAVSIPFAFEQNKTQPKGAFNRSIPADSIFQIEVLSYSSIEGTEAHNKALHEERAAAILREARSYFGKLDCPTKKVVRENWEKCYLQLELLGLDSIAKLPKDAIRSFVITDKKHNWDSLLYEQRISTAVFHIKGQSDSITQPEEFLNMNVRTALLNGNNRVANLALLKLYQENMPTNLLFEPGIYDRIMNDTGLVQNASALLTHHFNPKDIRVIGFVRNWLRDPYTLSEPVKRNLIHLYNLSTYRLLTDDWDVESSRFLRVLNPSKLYAFFENRPVSSVYDLNFHLTSMHYYELTGTYDSIGTSFKKIKLYFDSQRLSLEEELKIAQFFNYWSVPELCVDLLTKSMDSEDFSAEAAFILGQTITSIQYKTPNNSAIRKAAARAYELAPEKWCGWLQYDFQLYRYPELKNDYCIPCGH